MTRTEAERVAAEAITNRRREEVAGREVGPGRRARGLGLLKFDEEPPVPHQVWDQCKAATRKANEQVSIPQWFALRVTLVGRGGDQKPAVTP